MNWHKIVEKAIKDGASDRLLKETEKEMQSLLDFVMDVDPDVYCDFKSVVLSYANGSNNVCV